MPLAHQVSQVKLLTTVSQAIWVLVSAAGQVNTVGISGKAFTSIAGVSGTGQANTVSVSANSSTNVVGIVGNTEVTAPSITGSSNADLTTPFDGVTPTFNEVNNTVLANPPSITPSGVERLIVAAGFGASNGAVGTYSSPDLSDFVTEDASDTANISIGVGSHTQLTSSAYDPAEFTYSESSQGAYSCIGFTCVIKSANIS